MKISRIISLVLVLLFLLAVARLARLENGGPPHAFVMLPGQEPATLYLPGPGYPFYTLFPKPAGAGGRADSWLHRRSCADERARTTTGGERLRGAGDRRKRARRESKSVQWRRRCERQSARERKDRGRLSSRQSACRRIANRRHGAFDGRGRGARLRDARSESQGRGDDFRRLGAGSRASEERAVHFRRARPGRRHPGYVHRAGGASGGRAAK